MDILVRDENGNTLLRTTNGLTEDGDTLRNLDADRITDSKATWNNDHIVVTLELEPEAWDRSVPDVYSSLVEDAQG